MNRVAYLTQARFSPYFLGVAVKRSLPKNINFYTTNLPNNSSTFSDSHEASFDYVDQNSFSQSNLENNSYFDMFSAEHGSLSSEEKSELTEQTLVQTLESELMLPEHNESDSSKNVTEEKQSEMLSARFNEFIATKANTASMDDWADFFHKFIRLRFYRNAAEVIIEMKKVGLKPEINLYYTFLMASLNGLLIDEIVHIYVKPAEYLNRPHRVPFIESVKTMFEYLKEENPVINSKLYFRIASHFYRFKSVRYYRMLLEHLENNRIPISSSIFNMLMSLLAEYPNFYYNVKMIYVARKTTDEVDAVSTYWFLYATIKAKQFDELKSFMAELHSKNEAQQTHYDMIIRLLLKHGFLQEAISTFNDLKLLKGFEPSKTVYLHFLAYYGFKTKNQKAFFDIFADYSAAFPNVEGHSNIYALYFKAAASLSPQKAVEFLNVLIERKVSVTEDIYTCIINFLLSNNVSYEIRSFLSSIFANWIGVDETKSVYEMNPMFQEVSSKLPIFVSAIFGHMHKHNINSFTLENISIVVRYLFSVHSWDEIINLWHSVDKSEIFTKPNTVYLVLFAGIHLKNTRLVLVFLNYICKRRLVLLEKHSDRLLECLLEFPQIAKTHPIFKILRGSIMRRGSFSSKKDDVSFNNYPRGDFRNKSNTPERHDSKNAPIQNYQFNKSKANSNTFDRRNKDTNAGTLKVNSNRYDNSDRMHSESQLHDHKVERFYHQTDQKSLDENNMLSFYPKDNTNF